MGKYGIGARVRDEDGDEGVIVGKRKGERRVQYDEPVTWGGGYSAWMPKHELTPIAEPEPEWQPKVGDRVQFKTKNPSHCALYSPNPLTVERLGAEGRVTILYDPFDGYEEGDLTQTVQVSDLEPLSVAAEAQGAGNLEDNVTTIFDELEAWRAVDNPAAVAPATAMPAFKVGDRVKVAAKTGMAAKIGHTGTVGPKGVYYCTICKTDLVDVVWDDAPSRNGQSNGGYYPKNISPADAATIRPGAFANLRVKVTSVNGKMANVIIPGQRNPSHAVPLSELSA